MGNSTGSEVAEANVVQEELCGGREYGEACAAKVQKIWVGQLCCRFEYLGSSRD